MALGCTTRWGELPRFDSTICNARRSTKTASQRTRPVRPIACSTRIRSWKEALSAFEPLLGRSGTLLATSAFGAHEMAGTVRDRRREAPKPCSHNRGLPDRVANYGCCLVSPRQERCPRALRRSSRTNSPVEEGLNAGMVTIPDRIPTYPKAFPAHRSMLPSSPRCGCSVCSGYVAVESRRKAHPSHIRHKEYGREFVLGGEDERHGHHQ